MLSIVAYLTTGIFLHLAMERYLWLMMAMGAAVWVIGQQYVENPVDDFSSNRQRRSRFRAADLSWGLGRPRLSDAPALQPGRESVVSVLTQDAQHLAIRLFVDPINPPPHPVSKASGRTTGVEAKIDSPKPLSKGSGSIRRRSPARFSLYTVLARRGLRACTVTFLASRSNVSGPGRSIPSHAQSP